MVVVAIAGGTGKLGRAIVDVLVSENKHQVVVFGRKANIALEKEIGAPLIVVDYTNVDDLAEKLESNSVHTLISTIASMTEPHPDLNLVRAADRSVMTKRFVPSSWAIKYNPDLAKIFPPGRGKLAVLESLEATSLEYTSFLNGFFLDYFIAPHVKSYIRPMAVFVDVANKSAAIPGSGDVPVVFTYTFDIARFVAAALTLPKWEKESYIIGGKVTWKQFLNLAEGARGVKFDVTYDSLEELRSGKVTELPSYLHMYPFIGKEQLQGLFSSFGVMFEQGMFNLEPTQTLNEVFPDIKVQTIQERLLEAWKGK